jgi:hypothetical protein
MIFERKILFSNKDNFLFERISFKFWRNCNSKEWVKNFVERNLFLGEKEFQWNVIGSKDHGQVSKHLVVISDKSGPSLFRKYVQ